MPRQRFEYIDQDLKEPSILPGRRPSETMPDTHKSPTSSADAGGCNRPYFLEMCKEVEGRCSCCGTKLSSAQTNCPVCHSVNSRIG